MYDLPFLRRLIPTLLLALALSGTILPSQVATANEIYTPQRGTMERAQVLNAVRPLVEARVGSPVEFVVQRLRVFNGWAFVIVNPQRPGGKAISPNDPNYRLGEFQDGLHTYALLKYAYDRWNIIDYAIGPTDVFWQGDPLYEQFPDNFIMP